MQGGEHHTFGGEHHQCKVVLLGEGRVGKTSLLIRFVHNTFDERTSPTVQASYFDKRLTIGDATVKLAIWDTAGQERFHALGPIYYRDADAALLVFDLADVDSFEKVKSWVRELRRMLEKSIVLCIAGNKADIEHGRQVDREEARRYAQQVGAFYSETSAKHNTGIDEMFLMLAGKLVEVKRKEVAEMGSLGYGGSVVVVENPPAEPKQRGCC
mmetsp:Transcript_8150/g.24024  ORF Transcript_8150/g.24024 Transcript_8150/m.24024 type:complete len:213 (+) Transcript_8150:112-750(+)